MLKNKHVGDFIVTYDDHYNIKSLSHPKDSHKMNWVEGETPWDTVKCSKELSVNVTRKLTSHGTFRETYEFINSTDVDVFVRTGDIGIYTTFNDNYQEASVCMTNRCHTHIWCGGEVSYVMGLRMGGVAPHLGLVLTQGSLETYSIERDLTQISNDRGDFIMHPSPFSLLPGEKYVLEWELFWHEGKEDFYQRLLKYASYIHIDADKYGVYLGETVNVKAADGFGNEKRITDTPERVGEHSYQIEINGNKAKCLINVLPRLKDLAGARCRFIAEKQQFHKAGSVLDGAYLLYDNEEEHFYYSSNYDHNGGRERVGMGVLVARYLQANFDEALKIV